MSRCAIMICVKVLLAVVFVFRNQVTKAAAA